MDSRSIIDDTVATWAHQRPDLDFTTMGLFFMMSTLVRNMAQRTRPGIEALGLTHGEFDVLATLRRSGRRALLTASHIAEVAMVSPSGLTHRLTQLEKDGLIVRELDPDDRRSLMIRITPKGEKIADKAIEMLVEEANSMYGTMSANQRHDLRVMLEMLLDNAEITIDEVGELHAGARE